MGNGNDNGERTETNQSVVASQGGKNETIRSEQVGKAPSAKVPFIVGIGASAGGLESLKRLFAAMPADSGLAFVVVIHLEPTRTSMLGQILARETGMPVCTAEDGMAVEPNRVYVTPPRREITLHNGRLSLKEPLSSERMHHPVDTFFRSLAPLQEHAVAVVLSGAGNDGSQGIKAVKGAGGTTLVQDEESAAYPDMPRNAIATGMADHVLPAEEIAGKLLAIARSAFPTSPLSEQPEADLRLDTIFRIMKAKTGHDFSPYKVNMVMRRIERRLTATGKSDIAGYVAFLKEDPQEAQLLCQDMLIGVTSFFRDPEAFEALRNAVFPRLFADRNPDDPVRIWHASCSTGEEAYTMAIIVREYLTEHALDAAVQIFATDIDEAAIAQARTGFYAGGIETDLSPERLRNFFVKSGTGYQVVKPLREMIVFAPHSLLKDPPFSRLDLLVCRNFLIYLKSDMQQQLYSLFHLALKPGGVLFLGVSETVHPSTEMFDLIDKKWKIYERVQSDRRMVTAFPFISSYAKFAGTILPSRPVTDEPPSDGVVEKLLMERYVPPSVVVNENYEVIHFPTTRTSRFLEAPVGEPTRDILKMAREELRPILRTAIHKAFTEQKEVAFRGVKIPGNPEVTVNVQVEPIPARRLVLVLFEQPPSPAPLSSLHDGAGGGLPADESSKDLMIRQLEDQLHVTHEQLQATIEQLETSNEGLMSTNEELLSINEEFQSTNEELHSTNEELETSREELQALNGELVTVNAELQQKVEELNKANSDLDNLLTSSEIATIFLSRQLAIKRFSPAMAGIFNLIQADIGRPFLNLAGGIDLSGLSRDAEEILEKLAPIEREVTSAGGEKFFLMRVLPYRTTEGEIDGIVVTLVDITERKRGELSLKQSEERYRELFEHMIEGFAYCRILFENGEPLDFVYLSVNDAFERLTGLKDVIGKKVTEVIPGIRESDPELFDIYARVALTGKTEKFEKFVEALQMWFSISVYSPQKEHFVAVFDVITERKRAEEALRDREEIYSAIINNAADGIVLIDPDTLRFVEFNNAACNSLGYTREEFAALSLSDIHSPETADNIALQVRSKEMDGTDLRMDHRHRHKNGDLRQVHVSSRFVTVRGNVYLASVWHDVTDRKRAEEEREKSGRLESLGVLAGGIAHDFNNILTAVFGNISLARMKIAEDHPAAPQLASCEKALDKATDLTRQLLTFARGGEPIKGAVNTELLLREVVSFSLHGSTCKGELRLARGLWPLDADAGQIHQVLNNLLINAVQAMPDGGVITIAAANEPIGDGSGQGLAPGRYLKIAVADQGCGVPPENLPKIFDPYFTTKLTGTGLGLASVFSIVRRHGGSIDVASIPERGTTFTILLPADDGMIIDETASHKTAGLPSVAPPGKSVLVMDDEEMIRTLAAAMLDELGYSAVTCSDGAEAVEIYRKSLERGEPFSAVILDMTVPGGMGGKEAALKILTLDPEAVLIISSGYCVDPGYAGKKDAVFHGAVAKPYNIKQLAEELARLTRRGGRDGI